MTNSTKVLVTLVLVGLVLAGASLYYAGKSAGNIEMFNKLLDAGLIKE